MFVDTHCHLSLEDYDDISSVIEKNRKAHISKMIISGCTRATIEESLSFADTYPDVFVTIGYHPSEANNTTDDDLALLEKQIQHPKVVGIGEIGLDYHYGKEDMEQQKELFRKQLRLASTFHLPVVIHSRDAVEDTIQILKEFPDVVGDIHCFSGSLEVARIYLSMGYYLGIGGVVTFKNSHLKEVVKEVGISKILLETDAPYLAPEPFRGQKNSSCMIPIIADKLSDILEIPVKEVAFQTTLNAENLFDLH